MNGNQWARLLAYVTGLVNQELLLQNEGSGANWELRRFRRGRCVDPETDQAANAACQIS